MSGRKCPSSWLTVSRAPARTRMRWSSASSIAAASSASWRSGVRCTGPRRNGRRVYYGTLAGLIESLAEAKATGNLSRRLRVLTHPVLLVVDEIGYLPVTQEGAVLFFQLIKRSRRMRLRYHPRLKG